MNEERTKNGQRMVKNDNGIDHENISDAPRPRVFFFFLLLLTNFTENLSIYDAEPFSSAPSHLFVGNKGWRLHSSLPRRAGYFSPKLSGGPGEPRASLGEPGAWKSHQMTILSSF